MASRGRKRAAQGGGTPRSRQQRRARRQAIEELGSTRVHDRSRLPERMRGSLRLKLFLQSSALDFALVLLVSCALTYTVSYGFHSAWDYRSNVGLIVGLTAPVLLALYLGAWSKRALVPSVALTIALAVAYVWGASALSAEPLFVDGAVTDVEGNYVTFALIALVVPVVTYLLTRRTAGLAVMLLVSAVSCGLIQFLYREWITDEPGIAATLAVLFGLGMLYVYQCYRQSIYSANRVKRTSFLGAFAFSAVICAVCVAVGLGVFYGIVAASGLSTPEVKLIERYASPPVTDTAYDYELMDAPSDNTSDEYSDADAESDEEGESEETPNVTTGQSLLESTIVGKLAQNLMGINMEDDLEDTDDVQRYRQAIVLMWILYALILIALIVAVVLLWRYRRTWRLKRIARRSNAYQAWFIYTFLVGRFRRVRIAKPDHLTPLEFAAGFSKPMAPYTRGTGGVDFVEVASVYQDAVYGGIEPSNEQIERLVTYYRRFYANAFKETPWPKWVFWRFWRL